jgi:alpha-glucosidase
VYQLYIRSFSDRSGDGVGDLDGITDRLDHIAQLGVDAIWLNPCYPSPNNDGGYDVADYTGIDPMYGGLPAFEKLLSAAHERGIRVLMDLVPNHCSHLHPWFTEALAAPPGSAARARFHFRDGRGAGGSEPPNNWLSTFSGPAWTRVTDGGRPGQWYLHNFDSTQPDFNWANPEVADMFDGVLRTWFDRGVDGFRVDVADAMVKYPGLPDAEQPQDNPYTRNQPGVQEILARWRAIADSYDRDLPLIGEVWLRAAQAADYIRPGRLNQVFFFDLMRQPWDARSFRDSISTTLASVPAGGGVATWSLNNHDVHRAVSRYGLVRADQMDTGDANARRVRARGQVDTGLGIRRARAAVLLLLALPGSAYLYQGEELGLPEVLDLPADARRDPIWMRSGGREYGRDGSRVPLPWEPGGPSFGFSPPGSTPPWLPQPEWYREFAASAQLGDPSSTLTLYRTALGIRRSLFGGEELEWLDAGRDDVVAFRRGGAISVTVMGDEPFEVPPAWGLMQVSSSGGNDRVLAPGTGAWLRS